MLREVIDIASLEDFVSGLARMAGLRVCLYDAQGELIVASSGNNDFARLTGHVLARLPQPLEMVAVPAHDPPACIAYVESRAVWYIAAPVFADDVPAGYIAIGEFRDGAPVPDAWRVADNDRGVDAGVVQFAWESLPELDRGGRSSAVLTTRWAARQVSEWVRRESRLMAAGDEVALVGDIAQLLAGEEGLQTVLDRIVAETARVMRCPSCAMRLYTPETDELRIVAVHNLPTEYIGKGSIVRTVSSFDREALEGRVVYIEDAATDPRVEDPEEAQRRNITSILTAGMVYRGRPVGVIRVYTTKRRRFRQAQRSLLRAVAHQAAAAIMHARLVEERLRHVEMERQLALAGDLQARIVRTPPPAHPLIEAALVFEPTYHVAGDFCDFLTLCDGRLAAVVGDVVGKGIPASLLMSTVRGALRATAAACHGPGEIMNRLNALICQDTLPGEFVTLLLVALDRDARSLTYCSAGHEPLLCCRDGQVQSADEGDLVLGFDPHARYEEHRLALRPGDLLLLYTDGACEARNFADEEFGRPRVRQSLADYSHLRIDQVLDNLRWDVRRFVGLAERSDDLTLVGLRVRRPATPSPA